MKSGLLFLFLLAASLMAGCTPVSVITNNNNTKASEQENLYTAIFYIHADSDYLFHMQDGTPQQANNRAFSAATELAEHAKSGEVFIIHQKPQKKILGIFPVRSNEVYHFKNGELFQQITYRYQDNAEPFLATESRLFREHSTIHTADDHQTYFFFFGHEIPEKEGSNYHATLPEIEITPSALVSGLNGFLPSGGRKFDLVTLSTCSNGTPQMAKELQPVSHHLLASPQNLHLSHININAMKLLEMNSEIAPPEIAESIAGESFQRLTESVQTVVTLSLYDLEAVSRYIEELSDKVVNYQETEKPNPYRENRDCAELPFFEYQKFTAGIKTWYRPAAFGNRSPGNSHSGWGCKIDDVSSL